MAANTEKSVSLTNSDVQTFLEGKENQYTKRKTEMYVFSGFGNSISRGWERKSATGKFATGPFGRYLKDSSFGKDNVDEREYCALKVTSIIVFVIMIQRIFPFRAFSVNPLCEGELSISLFLFVNEVGFSFQ